MLVYADKNINFNAELRIEVITLNIVRNIVHNCTIPGTVSFVSYQNYVAIVSIPTRFYLTAHPICNPNSDKILNVTH